MVNTSYGRPVRGGEGSLNAAKAAGVHEAQKEWQHIFQSGAALNDQSPVGAGADGRDRFPVHALQVGHWVDRRDEEELEEELKAHMKVPMDSRLGLKVAPMDKLIETARIKANKEEALGLLRLGAGGLIDQDDPSTAAKVKGGVSNIQKAFLMSKNYK